jgi:hypothetical protein
MKNMSHDSNTVHVTPSKVTATASCPLAGSFIQMSRCVGKGDPKGSVANDRIERMHIGHIIDEFNIREQWHYSESKDYRHALRDKWVKSKCP